VHLVMAFGAVFALLTARPPLPAPQPAHPSTVHPMVRSSGSPPPFTQSNSVSVFAEFDVTPYCVLNNPSSQLLNFGTAPGNTPVGALFTANVTLTYFCDLGGQQPVDPLFSIYDGVQTGNPNYTLTGNSRAQTITYGLCPTPNFGGSGSCTAPYINSSSPSTAANIPTSGTSIPITGWFLTQTTPLIVDFYNDTLTAVIYF
jgi:hypothetical protein